MKTKKLADDLFANISITAYGLLPLSDHEMLHAIGGLKPHGHNDDSQHEQSIFLKTIFQWGIYGLAFGVGAGFLKGLSVKIARDDYAYKNLYNQLIEEHTQLTHLTPEALKDVLISDKPALKKKEELTRIVNRINQFVEKVFLNFKTFGEDEVMEQNMKFPYPGSSLARAMHTYEKDSENEICEEYKCMYNAIKNWQLPEEMPKLASIIDNQLNDKVRDKRQEIMKDYIPKGAFIGFLIGVVGKIAVDKFSKKNS